MNSEPLIDHLAALYGIPGQYIDAAGQPVNIASELKKTALEAMGVAVDSEPQIQASIATFEEKQWVPLLPKVHVVHQGKPFSVPMQVPETQLNNTFKGQLIPEKGDPKSLEIRAASLRELDRKALKNRVSLRLNLPLPDNLSMGYHEIILKHHTQESRCLLIVAPTVCYEPPALMSATHSSNNSTKPKNIWGSSIQLYTLRSEHNWGMGDFTDLKELVTRLAKEGADILGLNPIHALYPSNPKHCSPYSPSSRVFINPLYIDVCAVDGYKTCPEVMEQVNEPDFQNRLQQSRNSEYVDYALVASLKYPVLETLFKHFQTTHVSSKTEQAAAFGQYCRSKGQALERHGTYEALFEHFKSLDINSWGWPCWPSEYQHPSGSGTASFVGQTKDRIRFYMFLQWLAEVQLEEARQTALAAGMKMGIYRDLAVGVDRGGADVWSEPENYTLSASVGAPPDTVAPQGQNWGLPPFNPEQLANKAYGPFIEMVRANMQHCSALRIDHVMGLLRLWWCPPDKTADYGVYVNYPLNDLLGIIKLESQRNQCLVFGEDLGTVPPEIEATLPPARCYSNEVVLFSRDGEQFLPPEGYKTQALTCVSNHDIPTLKAWWNCNDLDLRQQLGIYDSERTQQEKQARHEDKVALLKTLRSIGELPRGMNPDDITTLTYSRDLMEKVHYYLAKTASRIVVVQLEDILGLDTPVNVPGTSNEYPNWQRKLTRNLSELFASEQNRAFFRNLSLTRRPVTKNVTKKA